MVLIKQGWGGCTWEAERLYQAIIAALYIAHKQVSEARGRLAYGVH